MGAVTKGLSRKAIQLASLFVLIWGGAQPLAAAGFSSDDECFSLTSATADQRGGPLKIGHITGSLPAQYQPLLPSACDASCAKLGRAYAHPGDEVAVGQSAPGFVCVHFADGATQNENHGWIPKGQVEILDPRKIDARLSEWVGSWAALQESATIRLESADGALHLIADAVYPNGAAPRSEGHIDAISRPTGSVVTFTAPDQCLISLTLISHVLAVTDNGHCGGANVRFADFYRSTPP